MRAIRWLVALSGLPFVWSNFELYTTQGKTIEMPKQAFPGIFNLREDPAGSESTSPDPAGHVSPRSTVQECFQVAEPILAEPGLLLRGQSNIGEPAPKASCSKLLMVHSFANSYYKPYTRTYQPPNCQFDRVVLKFEAWVEGTQFDRTGVLYFGDTLVWRTSTSEPDLREIHWTWHKDMTPFLSLWKKRQTLIFDLENIVNEQYTGIIKTTLTASFFKSDVQTGGHPPADLIIPITRGLKNKPSQFTVPQQAARRVIEFPENANRAVFSVDVKGQGEEEFWWHNLPQTTRSTFPRIGILPGYSSWREVQVELDGRLIGVVWPYPVIYTGGIHYALHRPLVGIDAFDLREHQIDITPWLPALCDGKRHSFTIKIVGLDDTTSPPSLSKTMDSWYVSGKIFVWLDDEGSVTTGTINAISHHEPKFDQSQEVTQDVHQNNATLEYTLTASRDFSVISWIKTQKHEGTVSWTQSLKYSKFGGIYQYGNSLADIFSSEGTSRADGNGFTFSTQHRYPLRHDKTITMDWDGFISQYHTLDQGLDLSISGSAVFPTGLEAFIGKYDGSALSGWRNGSHHVQSLAGGRNFQQVATQVEQLFSFGGKSQLSDGSIIIIPLYNRNVKTVNNALSKDSQNVAGDHR